MKFINRTAVYIECPHCNTEIPIDNKDIYSYLARSTLIMSVDMLPVTAREDEGAVKKTKSGHIYVLRSPRDEYKIGLTTQKPSARLKQISPQLPYKVDLILTVASLDVVKDEAYLHEYFADVRLNGEWFKLDCMDLEYIRAAEWKTM